MRAGLNLDLMQLPGETEPVAYARIGGDSHVTHALSRPIVDLIYEVTHEAGFVISHIVPNKGRCECGIPPKAMRVTAQQRM
jgi:hypothetical protein